MKKFLAMVLVCLLCALPMMAYGQGGQEHGDNGQGTTSTGSDGQGQTSQDRSGRN